VGTQVAALHGFCSRLVTGKNAAMQARIGQSRRWLKTAETIGWRVHGMNLLGCLQTLQESVRLFVFGRSGSQ